MERLSLRVEHASVRLWAASGTSHAPDFRDMVISKTGEFPNVTVMREQLLLLVQTAASR